MGIKRILIKIRFKLKPVISKFYTELIKDDFFERFCKNQKIVDALTTLKIIENKILNDERGVYMRFGDGDVFLLNKKSDMLQEPNDELSVEMREAFEINGTGVMKCLAIHSRLYGFDHGMSYGNHLNNDAFAKKLFRQTFLYFVGSQIYSPVALHYASTENVGLANTFLRVLKGKTKLFIGNESIDDKTLDLIFGTKSHIKTPTKNAYDQIDRIFDEAKNEISKFDDYGVVCVAMGCSGRPLMKRIYKEGFQIFIFDFGSLLDGIDGNQSRTWLKKNNIDYKKLLKDL